MTRRRVAAVVSALAGGAAAGYAAYEVRRISRAERERLAGILGWEPGRVVADVGAGAGGLAIEAARRVGPSGRVYATDVDPKKVAKVRRRAARNGLENVTALETGQSGSGLPPDSCDAILLRGSYHHFTAPSAMNAALYGALRTSGTLAVIDFAPRWWLSMLKPVKGVPANRGGHGIPRDVLVRELQEAGFAVTAIPEWFCGTWCVVARKPARA